MKKTTYLNFLMVALSGLMMISCSSSSDLSFADPNNPDETSATIQLLVTGAEAEMRSEMGIYLRAVGIMGREAYYFEGADPRYSGELLTGPIDPGGFLTGRPWTARYRVVKNCNLILEKAAEEGDSGAAGFAKTIMAQQLLLNLNYMDSNGIRTDVATEPLGPVVGKSAALDFIANTLDSGYTDLQGAGGAFSFNLSSGFADFNTPSSFATFNRALAARVDLYREDAQGALDALAASFINDSSPLDTTTGVYHVYSTASGDQVNPMYEVPTAESIILHGHPSMQTDAEAGDGRYAGKIFERASDSSQAGLFSNLAVTSYSSNTAPIGMVRNEELVLMRAEANIWLGNYGAAAADINLVREAAGLGPVTLDASNAIDQLLHERRYSLFLEGHRWVDMRRFGRLSSLPLDRAGDVVIERMPLPIDETNAGKN